MKQYYRGKEEPSIEQTRQSLEDKPREDVRKNSHQDRTICYKPTDLASAIREGMMKL